MEKIEITISDIKIIKGGKCCRSVKRKVDVGDKDFKELTRNWNRLSERQKGMIMQYVEGYIRGIL